MPVCRSIPCGFTVLPDLGIVLRPGYLHVFAGRLYHAKAVFRRVFPLLFTYHRGGHRLKIRPPVAAQICVFPQFFHKLHIIVHAGHLELRLHLYGHRMGAVFPKKR